MTEMTREMRLTRALVDLLPERVDERGPVVADGLVAPDFHGKEVKRIISEMTIGQDLWVFAAGSLIWRPRCPVVERRRASVEGWRRSFCYGPDKRFRETRMPRD